MLMLENMNRLVVPCLFTACRWLIFKYRSKVVFGLQRGRMEEEGGKEYRWESGYEKTWEAIQEDKEGLLDYSVQVTRGHISMMLGSG